MNKQKRKSFISAAVVMALESYDFTVFLLLIRGSHFVFSPAKYDGYLFIFDFLLGLLARPLGALALGRLSDKYGRKPLLILVTYLMASFTLFFSFLPSKGPFVEYIPYFLVAFRALQGMIFGSSIVITNSYFAELAPTEKRGFYTSFVACCQEIGTLLAVIVSISFYAMPQSDYMIHTAWRIPFISGALSILIGLHLRYGMMESPCHKPSYKNVEPLKILFKNYWSSIIKVFLIVPVFSICFYLFRVFILNQSEAVLSLSVTQIMIVSLTACLVSMFTSLLGGFLSDLVGRRPILIASSIAILLLSWPALTMIYHPGDSAMVFIRMLVAQIMIAIFAGLYAGALAPLTVELFPAKARATAVGLTYNLAISLIAGSSPLYGLYAFYGEKSTSVPAVYLTVWAAVAIFVIGFHLKESHKSKLISS